MVTIVRLRGIQPFGFCVATGPAAAWSVHCRRRRRPDPASFVIRLIAMRSKPHCGNPVAYPGLENNGVEENDARTAQTLGAGGPLRGVPAVMRFRSGRSRCPRVGRLAQDLRRVCLNFRHDGSARSDGLPTGSGRRRFSDPLRPVPCRRLRCSRPGLLRPRAQLLCPGVWQQLLQRLLQLVPARDGNL